MYIPNFCFLNTNNDKLKRNIININVNNNINIELKPNALSNEPIKNSFNANNDIVSNTIISNTNIRYGPLYFLYQFEDNVLESFLIFLSINNKNDFSVQR